jgi:hypothetical protein
MKNLLTVIKSIGILAIGVYPLSSQADAQTNGDMEWSYNRKSGVTAVEFQQYAELCGRCHFAFQPGLLPARSWEKIMTTTDAHFGENLKLTSVEKRTMTRYVLDNSAGHVNDDISYKILKSLNADPSVTQITMTPYFVKVHQKLESVTKMKSMVQCDTCHQDAKQGKY